MEPPPVNEPMHPKIRGAPEKCARVISSLAAAFLLREWLVERGRRRNAEGALQGTQAELRRFSEEVESRIVERTHDLQQTIECLQVVLYHLAHDLRAPLRAMAGFAAFLNEKSCGELTKEGRESTERIAAAAVRLDRLIHDLLDFGRLGYEPLRCQPTGCEEVFSRLLNNLKDEINRCHAEVEMDPDLPSVVGHARLLEIVFEHLLSNALKFTKPDQAPKVHIGAARAADVVTIYIEDNGVGIEPEYHEKIFGPFERCGGPAGGQSTGMGLAIARKAVERMGGRIGLESMPGQGSRFWVQLKGAKN